MFENAIATETQLDTFTNVIVGLLSSAIVTCMVTLVALVIPALRSMRKLQHGMMLMLVHLPFPVVKSFFMQAYQVDRCAMHVHGCAKAQCSLATSHFVPGPCRDSPVALVLR